MHLLRHCSASLLLTWQLIAGIPHSTITVQQPPQDNTKPQASQEPSKSQTPTAPQPSQGNTKSQTSQDQSKSQPSQQGQSNPNSVKENGITIGKPKQFDERTLTLMLRDLEERLVKSQFPDPSNLYSSVGRFAGATANTSSMALSVRGPSLPSITSTLSNTNKTGNTGSSTDTAKQASSDEKGSSTENSTSATVGNSSEITNTNQQQITQAGLAPPTASLPGQTSLYSYQPPFGISPQDTLAEQTSLFYQIVNLRLLLDRSLTDRIKITPIKDPAHPEVYGTTSSNRVQVVLGFQISIDAVQKDAVAEAEITFSGGSPSLVSLLPRDKTYNVASITKDSKAVDLGAVVQFVGVGAAVGKTQESLYLVKDTDTVALERASSEQSIKFAWQFRPVLGRQTVEPGMRQVYALISLDTGPSLLACKITATTKWRKYDQKRKTVGEALKPGPQTQYNEENIQFADISLTDRNLGPIIYNLDWSDLGNGQVLIIADGEGFTSDTNLVLGEKILDRPENGLTVANEQRLRIIASGQTLTQTSALVVGRYGTASLVRPCERAETQNNKRGDCLPEPYSVLFIEQPVIRSRDPLNSEVTVRLTGKSSEVNIPNIFEIFPPIVVFGGKVFGLGDAPFISRNFGRTEKAPYAEFTFVMPTQLLANARTLTFKELLRSENALTFSLNTRPYFTATGLTTLGSNGDSVQLAIFGGGFKDDIKVQVGNVTFAKTCPANDLSCGLLKLNASNGNATLISLSPTKGQIKDVKNILVWQGEEQPITLALAQPPTSIPMAKILKPSEPLSVSKGDSIRIKFEGANFESIKKVMFEGKELESKLDDDDKAIYWLDLPTFLTGEVGKKRLKFIMKDDKELPFTITVVPQ